MKKVAIGGGQGFWGDSNDAAVHLLRLIGIFYGNQRNSFLYQTLYSITLVIIVSLIIIERHIGTHLQPIPKLGIQVDPTAIPV